MKKIVLLVVALIVVLAALAACAPAPTATPMPKPTDAPKPTTVPPTVAPTAAPKPTEAPKPAATDGAGLLSERCSTCHNLDRVKSAAKSKDQWTTTVDRMIGKGAKLTGAEKSVLIEYLAKTYAAAAAPKACEKMPNALAPKAGELGAADKPIVITFVPSVDAALITKGGTAMADCLTKMTGLTFKIEVGTSETASVEAMGGNKAQFGFLNTFAVLLAKEKYDVDVLLVAQRMYGVLKPDKTYTAFDFDPDKALAGKLTSYYKPEYYTRVGSGIKTLADVKGKSFCFTSASSTSGGIIPRAVFKALGIDPDKDMKSSYAGGHDKAAIAVYDGTCDAGVAFMDILTDSATNLVSKFPDIQQKVQVFAVGDRIPNDGLQSVKGLDPKIKDITVEALLVMMADPAQNAVIKGIYNYDAFEKADYAKYYGPFNDTLKKAGIDVSSLVRK